MAVGEQGQQRSTILLKPGDRIVFFGDSITHATPGYVSFIGEMLESLYPELGVAIINRGGPGNNVHHLMERVDRDVVAESPDWVSISIGINDCYYPPHHVEPSEYKTALDGLVQHLRDNGRASIILCSPSIVGEDPDSEDNGKLRAYVDAVREVAEKHGTLLAPVHEAFINALRLARPTTDRALFTTDGVHLNQAGNTLLGTTWLKTMGGFDDLLPEEGRP